MAKEPPTETPQVAGNNPPADQRRSSEIPQVDPRAPRGNDDGETALRHLGLVMGMGAAFILAISVLAPRLQEFFYNLGVCLLVAGASTLTGGLLGFLFGIPRTLQTPDAVQKEEDEPSTKKSKYQDNTNLEQISDWLTKILVGVGLTQLTSLPERLGGLSDEVGKSISGLAQPEIAAGALIVLYAICGFLYAYLWTRLYLASALESRASWRMRIDQRLIDLEQQRKDDATALSLVERHLDPRSDSPDVDSVALMEAIGNASPAVKTSIHYRAWKERQESWTEVKNVLTEIYSSRGWDNPEKRPQPKALKPDQQARRTDALKIIGNAAKVFEALVQADLERSYHTNFAQLAFCLKDQKKPEYRNAANRLSDAIEIRDGQDEKGWRFYEFNRALCEIALQLSEGQETLASGKLKQTIISDLERAAAANNELESLILGDQALILTGELGDPEVPPFSLRRHNLIRIWMRRNGVSFSDVGIDTDDDP